MEFYDDFGCVVGPAGDLSASHARTYPEYLLMRGRETGEGCPCDCLPRPLPILHQEFVPAPNDGIHGMPPVAGACPLLPEADLGDYLADVYAQDVCGAFGRRYILRSLFLTYSSSQSFHFLNF